MSICPCNVGGYYEWYNTNESVYYFGPRPSDVPQSKSAKAMEDEPSDYSMPLPQKFLGIKLFLKQPK